MTDTVHKIPSTEADSVLDYRKVLRSMTDDLKRLRGYAHKLELDEVADQADKVLDRVENQFFNVAVVGEFKRGKSTLINALLGREILPSDVLPCSATLNRITYGSPPSVKLVFKATEDEEEKIEQIPVEELVNFVTKLTPESEVRASNIEEAVVYYPTPYCRDKADIYDTPGLNDDENMSEVTYSILPKVDAAIMVILAQAPFAQYESQFLANKMLMENMGRVMFVANRIDEIRKEEDRIRVVDAIAQRIMKTVNTRAADLYGEATEEYEMFVKRIGPPKVFGVSSLDALEGKINSDQELVEKSGFLEFEAALEHFLTHDRGNVTLQVLADTSIGATGKILHKISLTEGALQMQAEEFEDTYQMTLTQLQDLRTRYQYEMEAVDRSAQAALANARFHLENLGSRVRDAVIETVDAVQLTPNDIDKKQQQTVESLNKRVEETIQSTIQLLAEKMQLEIERELNREIDRLSQFATVVNSVLGEIEIQFTRLQSKRSTATEGALAAIPIVGGLFVSNLAFGLGGIVAGYREAGLKGALVGGAAGAATGVGAIAGSALVAVGILGLSVTWPVVLAVGLVGGISSFLGGRGVTRRVFAQQRVEKFKEDYKTALLSEIEEQLKTQKGEFDRKIGQQVKETFDALKQHVQQELKAPIDQTQKTLTDLRNKLTRSETEREIMLKQLAEMRLEVEKIHTKAVAKSKELREITSV